MKIILVVIAGFFAALFAASGDLVDAAWVIIFLLLAIVEGQK